MEIYGNKSALKRLSEYKKSERMPHSLLFFGDAGTGKRTLADYTAMLYFCESGGTAPCMTCLNCERTEKHIHPDVIYINCENTSVTKLRETLRDSIGASVEGGIRVYIFSEFQFFNRECQNALLTYLEEPSDKIRFILTASNKNGILPTILSRIALIQTEPLTVSECENALKDRGTPDDEAEKLARMYKGNLGMSLMALESKNAAVYFDFAKEYAEAVYNGEEYKALTVIQRLPQPKDDKREPARMLVAETAKLFHDAFARSCGGKASCGCDERLAEKLAEKYSVSLLGELCEVSQHYNGIVSNIYFNSKVTLNAFTARIFESLSS
ncbi:MAG: hypothetical protein HDT48_01400 [Ruminococcaceae bacterium]|nr:hypothetical protein [Oscillospiraceae bacterium]